MGAGVVLHPSAAQDRRRTVLRPPAQPHGCCCCEPTLLCARKPFVFVPSSVPLLSSPSFTKEMVVADFIHDCPTCMYIHAIYTCVYLQESIALVICFLSLSPPSAAGPCPWHRSLAHRKGYCTFLRLPPKILENWTFLERARVNRALIPCILTALASASSAS